ncbi:MAG: DNA primase [Bdellovibrionales bacterium]|nr:DNA primase [Bdellovibrionales bacterium]
MARISDSGLQSFKQELRNRLSILDVVGEHVVLRKSGANHMGLCPFHSERSPSFTVNESKQMFHCFGCKKGGDLITFVMEIHGLGFMEALEELAERAKMALPRELAGAGSKDDPERAKMREEEREKVQTALKLNRFAAAFYRERLSQIPEAQAYFRKRGIDPLAAQGIARNFYLGASPGGWDGLARHLSQAKAPLGLAQELGLIRSSQRGQGHFDMFRSRAMFPILDLRGKVVAFGGRTIPELSVATSTGDGKEEKEAGPKYLNSSESFVFRKGKVAYGLFQAQKHIRESDEIILVEGYFDVLGLHAGGFENAVATCGTALTPDHLHVFKRLGSRVVLLFDSDRAGEEATDRAMELGLQHGWVLYGATLPKGVDPDEVIFDRDTGAPLSDGRDRMRDILKASQPLIDVRMGEAVKAASGGPEALSLSIKKIAGWLKMFSDPVGREVRIRSASQALGVEPRLLASSAGITLQAESVRGRPQPKPMVGPPQAGSSLVWGKQEQVVLRGLVWGKEFSEVLAQGRAQLPPGMGIWELFEHPEARQWVERVSIDPKVLENFRSAPETSISEVGSRQVLTTITEALFCQEAPHRLEDFQRAVKRQIGRAWARFSQHVKKSLAAAEANQDAELQAKLMQEYIDVQRKIKEFTSFYDEAE